MRCSGRDVNVTAIPKGVFLNLGELELAGLGECSKTLTPLGLGK
jgi:hypothetical protein